jgi:hypothetical protein
MIVIVIVSVVSFSFMMIFAGLGGGGGGVCKRLDKEGVERRYEQEAKNEN